MAVLVPSPQSAFNFIGLLSVTDGDLSPASLLHKDILYSLTITKGLNLSLAPTLRLFLTGSADWKDLKRNGIQIPTLPCLLSS